MCIRDSPITTVPAKISSPRSSLNNSRRAEVVQERGYIVDDDDEGDDDMVVQDVSAAGFSSFLGNKTAKQPTTTNTTTTHISQPLQRGNVVASTTSAVVDDAVVDNRPYRNNTPLRIDKDHDDDEEYYDEDGLCSNVDDDSTAAEPHDDVGGNGGEVEPSDDLYDEAPSSKLFRTTSVDGEGATSTTSLQQHTIPKDDTAAIPPIVARRISMTSVGDEYVCEQATTKTSMYSSMTPHMPEGGNVEDGAAGGGGSSSVGVLDLEALHSESMGGAAPPATSAVDYIGSVRSRPNTPNRLPSTRL
eukprot:TRINITY_DN6030_c0_g1_i7.p1 TRINITY_DN6030_c0_g1~~TRINITY_DN6030_c0_g1_i7.p1  ORF type:complete len:302 (+),score=68.00 TRINITY_DN6030_c0_g1_i7:197-1102(+)